jgi:tetratricopeptide (TPR) repeat protein
MKNLLAMPALTSFQTLAAALLLVILTAPTSLGHGAYHDLIDKITTGLKANPDDAALRYKLAEAHAGHEEWQACLIEIDRVERLAPGIHPTGYLRGLALLIGGKFEQAKDTLDGFLSARPTHMKALATRGRVLVKLGRPADAAVDFEAAMKSSAAPGSELVMDLALAHQQAGKPEESSRVVDEALKSSNDIPSLLECALKIETAAGRWDSALSRIDGLQMNAPRPEPWMAKRAELLTKAGRAEDARVAWSELRIHLNSLPSLDRGTPQNSLLLTQAKQALGESNPKPVFISPAF